ncbi:hypothetical protein ACHAXR_006101 [Thalassiosira sp. AJA248-18]
MQTEIMDGFITPTKESMPTAASITAALQEPQRHNSERLQPIHLSLPWETSFGQEKLAVIVPHVLSEEECTAIIQNCEEQHGFEQALLNVGGGRQVLDTDVRKSGRCIIDDEQAAAILWERLKHVLPEMITPGFRTVSSPIWQCVGLNERFRVLKYQPGDYFYPHRDGSFERSKDESGAHAAAGKPGDTSFFTVMLYLNTPTKGGGTNFVSVGGNICPYNPIMGQALVFDHGIRHEGAPVKTGVKYAIRTDLMYRRVDTSLHETNARIGDSPMEEL